MHGLFVRLPMKRQIRFRPAAVICFCCTKSRSKIHIALQYNHYHLLQTRLSGSSSAQPNSSIILKYQHINRKQGSGTSALVMLQLSRNKAAQ